MDSLIARQVLATRSIADTVGQLSERLDSLQRKTHPRAHRVHECVYYTRQIDVPSMGPRDTRVMAVRLADVQASDVPGFARPANAETARQLHVQIITTMDGFARLAFTNLTSHYLHPGVQAYEFGLWVPDAK